MAKLKRLPKKPKAKTKAALEKHLKQVKEVQAHNKAILKEKEQVKKLAEDINKVRGIGRVAK